MSDQQQAQHRKPGQEGGSEGLKSEATAQVPGHDAKPSGSPPVNAGAGVDGARMLVAFVGEDEELDHVARAGIELARRNHARIVLYDRDAATAFADPLPNQWASSHEREQYGDPLSDDELVRLGREPLARKVAAARREGVDAWGWLAERHGTDTMVDYAREHDADLVLLPDDLDEPGLADRLKRETVERAVEEATEEPQDGVAVLLVSPDGSTELAAGRL